MSVTDYSLVTAVVRKDALTFSFHNPPGWEQGRGAFGGVVIGAMARAALASEPDGTRALRSVAAELLGPVPVGELVLTVTTLRRGNALSAYAVTLCTAANETDVLAHGSFTLARPRVLDRDFLAIEPPRMPSLDASPVMTMAPPLGPAFSQHVAFRSTGPLPFSGGAKAESEGFIELRECSSWGPPEWLALADCYWPSLLARESAPRPTATIGFTCHLFATPPKGPLFFRARSLASSEGFVSESRELWTLDGKLVLLNPQLFAIVA